ncbi:MAG TPA: 2-iminoacetate synthase ThiH [Verrucomicrobiae bacterium]|nr:2-iminoacetate synthase ThiH [Verrucomicrobiae bacterium]
MSFSNEFKPEIQTALARRCVEYPLSAVQAALNKPQLNLYDFAALISPAGSNQLEELGQKARRLTQQRFGRVIRLFAPLYLSNECINNCKYCGFSRDNPIFRVTLSLDEVRQEARELVRQGFRNILLVSGEHPKFISNAYLENCVRAVHEFAPAISLEVGPMETSDYEPLVQAGAEGLVVYQETYDPEVYAEMHVSGPKRNFSWRLDTPERAYTAGFRRLGIGALYGLADWRYEALCLAAHTQYLLRTCWKAWLTVSLPRLRPCAGEFQPRTGMDDRAMTQLVCAFRLMFPDVGLVLSTRESPNLRDGLVPLGITLMSAGSHTEPGGYTGAGSGALHHTERGRIVELGASEWAANEGALRATGQFNIADERSPAEVAQTLKRLGYEPVWKDWDAAITP